jgi:putative transcriptional regulator
VTYARTELPPGRIDRARLRATTDEEIARQIAADPDLAPDMGDVTEWKLVYNPPLPNVRAIRERLGLSQSAFATRFGLNTRTVQQWEQGRAIPDRPARILLHVIAHAPQVVEEAIAAR